MAQRILTLTTYLLRSLIWSLAGLFYLLISLAFWRLLFPPQHAPPEASYFILVIAVFGAGMAFLVTLSVATRANQAGNYPLLARLPSRVEHLTAVLISTLFFTLLLRLLVAFLAGLQGTSLTPLRTFEIPPLWLAIDILAATLALHASELVAAGWSRVYIFGLLAIFLFGRGLDARTGDWFAGQAVSLSNFFYRQDFVLAGDFFRDLSQGVNNGEPNAFSRLFDLAFWPFGAIIDASLAGSFTAAQAMAPALLLLYATILFILAADLFAHKDLFLNER